MLDCRYLADVFNSDMIRNISLTILFSILTATAFGQSGRVKPKESPTPAPPPRPRVIYTPTENGAIFPVQNPLPKITETDGDIITIDSALVPIPVSVLNATGQTVTNLRLEDFDLFIDGQKAEIGDIARSETPVRLALLFDNSSSVSIAREFEKKAAIKFFSRVIRPEKDLAALYSVSTVSRLEQNLTKDISSLVRAIENFAVPEGATALLDGIIKASEYLGEIQGRRVIVIVSDGDDTISDSTLEQTVKSLQLANCQVYIVNTKEFENYKRTGQRGGNANIRALTAERRMQEITQQTGGAVYSPIDERELERAFNQISAELAQQYILSYYPEDERDRRGDFRAISLNVKNSQNLTIRTRKGYYVPRQR